MSTIFDYEHPYVCTDAVVFSIGTGEADNYRKLPRPQLKVLLYQRQEEPCVGKWSLPGGFLNIDELPEHNIRRKLSTKTEMAECFLEQLFTFCDLDRDPRARVLSIAYLGLISEANSREIGSGALWFALEMDGAKGMRFRNGETLLTEADFGFDHGRIIGTALGRLRSKILYTDLIFHLLQPEFTLTQLQNVYDAILDKPSTAANFRRKIGHMVQETERYTADKGHRPARYYVKKAGGGSEPQ